MGEIPTNPKTGEPYFQIDPRGFGDGWQLGPAAGAIEWPWPKHALAPGSVSMNGMHDDGEGNLLEDSTGEKVGVINYVTTEWSTFRARKW